jgi:hypothetical protein
MREIQDIKIITNFAQDFHEGNFITVYQPF